MGTEYEVVVKHQDGRKKTFYVGTKRSEAERCLEKARKAGYTKAEIVTGRIKDKLAPDVFK